MLITNWHHISEDTRQNYNKKNLFYEFEELFLILMHPCAVTHPNPNLHLTCFIFVIVRELLLRKTMNTYNANECIVVTYLFKDVERGIKKI